VLASALIDHHLQQALEAIQGPTRIAPDRVREALRESIVALDGALARGAARFGERTPLFDHPYVAGLTADQWRRFHWRHAVHHAKQIVARTRRG